MPLISNDNVMYIFFKLIKLYLIYPLAGLFENFIFFIIKFNSDLRALFSVINFLGTIMEIILASSSKYRAKILKQLKVKFKVKNLCLMKRLFQMKTN